MLHAPRCSAAEAANTDFVSYLSATDCLDGDLTSQVKLSMNDSLYNPQPGDYPVTAQVSNSAGDVCSVSFEITITDNEDESIKQYPALSEYIVYTTVGNMIDPMGYVVGLEQNGQITECNEDAGVMGAISVNSEVNYEVPGVYPVEFSYTGDGTLTAVTKMFVVVEGNEDGNNRENASAQTETEFEPISLVCDILKNWWVILFGALAGAMLFYVASSMIYVPNYRTQATFVITSRANANAYNNLSSANSMAETFQKILESTIMKKTICEKLDMDKLDADISANVVNGTNILTLSVTAHSPKDSIDIIKTVMDNYTSISYYTVGTTVLDVLEDPKIPYAPVNPPQNGEMAKKGFFLGMAVCMLLFAIWSYMHNTVKQEREVEKKLDARSLGAISYEWKYKTIKEWIKHRKKAVLVDNPLASFRFVESFKMLAARVEYHMSKINGKILVVTSVCENEGKSSVAGILQSHLRKKARESF